jgi:glycosyltransferase involved in cell wall biosynthesis
VDTSYFTPAPPRRTFEHEQEEEWLAAWKKDLASHEDHAGAIISGLKAASLVRKRNDGDGVLRTDRSEVTVIAEELDSGDIRENVTVRQPNELTDEYLKKQTEDTTAASYANPPRPLRILYPRRISMERGIIPMMLAADRLLGAFPDLEVEFAGELVEGSTVGRSFRYWHRTHPHADRIKHRTYDFRDIREAYHQADIAVIPTVFSEGTSYACLEAMSCGLPVVASNVGGLNDLIQDGFNGLLVPPGEEALTAALVRLVQDRAERERLGIYARETALSYDISHWRSRWSTVLESFLAEAGLKEGIRG